MANLVNTDGVPLRLYFAVEEGQTASLEVVSRASLAFASGVRELAYIFDPTFEARLGIEGHADGSLWQDMLLSTGRKLTKEYQSKPTLYNLAAASLLWLVQPPLERIRDNAWAPILKEYIPNAEERERARQAEQLLHRTGNIATQQRQQFYREVERDTVIEGVGLNYFRRPPVFLVPRRDFPQLSGRVSTTDSGEDRTSTGVMRVIIISPVLEVSTSRRWKFAGPQGEFGAAIKDRRFLEGVMSGLMPIRMRGGVELDVLLETKERLIDGVWTITERSVLRVTDVHEPPQQASMLPPEG